MAYLYDVKVKSIDVANKIAILDIDTIHPDAMYFSNNLAFAIRLIRDAALGASEFNVNDSAKAVRFGA
ncbi:hypothetical protein [Flavobacterium sp. WV_118_3]|uniref:hypothetical protein n=1 Tax=Flavobacterium sp. WV_118_3 TaxID=3151764 RepID=UPI0032195A28